MQSVEIVEADLSRPEHQQAVVELLDAYAAEPDAHGMLDFGGSVW